jgi:hypothetical protein
MRWRYGDTNPVVLAVDSATVIEIGDLLYLDTDDAKPASSQTDAGSEAANQDLFVDNFVGVAMQASRAGDTENIRVATTGVFEFDCAAATFEIGDLIGVDENSDGDALENQKVVKVNDSTQAIGLVAKRFTSNTTSVLVDVRSTKLGYGVKAGSASTAN